jgi:hypothetical membrane protein
MSRRLLILGASAGPLYVVLGLVQALLREGFDPRRHALSILANGELGWIQVANFLVSGALVVAGAVGARRALRGQAAGLWGPILLGLYGVGMLGAGIFRADPAQGFPPGAEISNELTRSGLLHFVFGAIAFYALIAACFVFARRFLRTGRRGLALYAIVTGVGFFVSFAAIASGSTSAVTMLAFYVAIAWVWVWHTHLHLHLRERFDRRT